MTRVRQGNGILRTAFLSILAAFACIAFIRSRDTAARDSTPFSARDILQRTGVRGGLIVHLNCGDGKLTAALRANDSTVVQGLDQDPKNVTKARRHIRSLGLYGPVSVEQWDGKSLPYADNLVNLVVAETKPSVSMAEIMRVLCPRGVAYIKQGDGWIKKVKPVPNDIDDWTSYLHGPDNNAVAADERAGPPRRLQWKSGPTWCRSHDGVASSVAQILSSDGRLFSVIDEGVTGQPGLPSKWTLVARDAFNGTLLWKRPLRGKGSQKSLVAAADKLYLAPGRGAEVTVIDAATGRTLRTLKDTQDADQIVHIDGLVAVHRPGMRRSSDNRDDSIVAVSTDSGGRLWQTKSKHVVTNTMAAADGRLCYYDGQEVVCLDLHNGSELWRVAGSNAPRGCLLMIYRGVVFLTARRGLQAYDAETGEHLWTGPVVNQRLSAFGAHGLVWVSDINQHGRTFLWTPQPVVANGYDPHTGQIKRTVTVPRLVTPGHHIRCYQAKATERYLILPKRGMEFIDLEGDNHMRTNWLRGACGFGIVPANGLVYAPPHQCFCYPGVKLIGFNAVSPDPVRIPNTSLDSKSRLQEGPAYSQIENRNLQIENPSDWPMYRHDPQRSGRAGCDVPVDVTALWQHKFQGAITEAVVANGRAVVAEKDTHTVFCLNAENGESLWQYTTGGRIDSSPTLYDGKVIFGSTDGWLYCLRAADGRLVWRFRAAPDERHIVIRSQLESAWPVHGSVVVQNGVVYCSAGRSSFLDGGIWIYALDPQTGKVLHEKHIESPEPDVTSQAGRPFDMEGLRTDLLVSDGTDLYMFFTRLSPDLQQEETPRITKLGDRKVSVHLMSNSGFLDTSWFDRDYWTYGDRWPGYYFGYDAPKSGQLLVFDKKRTYGVDVFTTRQGHSPRFWPGTNGYTLFADTNTNKLVLRPTAIGREKGDGYSAMLPHLWVVKVPIRMRAMVLAGSRLYVAGPPDVVPKDDPMAAFEGRLGGRLWVVSTSNGERLAQYKLDSPPVPDGMMAAGGRLYLADRHGVLTCMGKKP